nr:MAG TPA: transmembrane G protein-coupled receptor [Caudoviricetes sp.]
MFLDRIKCNGFCLLVLNPIIYTICSVVKKENTFSTCFIIPQELM